MKHVSVLMTIFLASCGGGSNTNKSPDSPEGPIISPITQPSPPIQREEPEDKIIYEYEPEWVRPLYASAGHFPESQTPYVDDYFRYLKEWLPAWSESREGGYIPVEYLSLWDGSVKYVDDTEGKVNGIEKLELIREKMLSRCPVLALPEHNSPVEVHWDEIKTNGAGKYRSIGVRFTEVVHRDGTRETRYRGGIFPWLNSAIWIYGKNSAWDFPKQTTSEIGKPWGIDWTFVHEWGHHLMFSIDINLGRTHYMTHELSESFATTIEAVCAGNYVVSKEYARSTYEYDLSTPGKVLSRASIFSKQSDPLNGTQYALRSMESCLAHEIYHDRFDPNQFTSALIEAYKRVEGRKLDPLPYPISFSRGGGHVQAMWVSSSPNVPRKLINNQPMQATRSEFLERFLEVYDCGLANELIKADIEGKLKFEW